MNDVVQFILQWVTPFGCAYVRLVFTTVHCSCLFLLLLLSLSPSVCVCARLAIVLKSFRCHLATCDHVCSAMNK